MPKLTIFPPLEVIASWPAPNFVNPIRHGPALLILCCTIGPLAFLMVAGRLWTRFYIQRNGGIDDWLMAVGLIPLLSLLIAIGIMSNDYGFDRHIWDNPFTNLVPERKLAFAAEISYLFASCFIKSSILLFYRRMSLRSISRTFIIVTQVSLASVVLATIAFTAATLYSCRYVFSYWYAANPFVQVAGAKFGCENEFQWLVCAFVVTCLQDFIVTMLPFLLFWKLQIPRKQKVALGAVFAVGFVVCGMSCMRLYYIYQAFEVTYDATWTSWYIWIWMLLEMMFAAMGASAPALQGLVHHYFGTGMSQQGPRKSVEKKVQSTYWPRSSTYARGASEVLLQRSSDDTRSAHTAQE